MTKRIITLIFFVFLTLPIFSQDIMAYFREEAPSFISINAGCSFPTGRFSQKTIYGNYDNPYHLNVPKLPLTGSSDFKVAGFANPGVSISVNGAWFFIKFLGIGVRASLSQNFLATKRLNKVYDDAYNISEDNIYSFDFSTNDYYFSAFAAPAIFFSIPIVENIYFSLEAGFGPFYSHFPQFTCDYALNDVSYKEVTQSASTWDFSYYMAVGAKFRSDGRFGLNVELSYNEFSPEYKIITTRGMSSVENTVPVFYKNLNLSLGLVMFLGGK
ncbi:hypothetical protein LJC69_00570 [Bacteroidales bacterium OttesenSCG-928-K22]|nr:hypothetical protein [Bacteroidales bacterium OttesenSCG-928-K22]